VWLILILLVSAVWAQTPERVTAAIDSSESVALSGGVSPKVRSSVDEGAVDPLFKLSNIRMSFKQTPEQQAALKQLLAAQQDPSSPNYHQWLTPEEFGDRFGLNQSDIARISRWLELEGFSIIEVARGRNWISFSGTAGQVQHTFHTQIHHVTRGGEEFFANVTEASIPKALEGVVSGFLGLDNFKVKSAIVRPKARPAYTDLSGNNYLSPDDIATIYDLAPLYKGGIDGTGQKIAIMGQTDIHMTDIENFRSAFGLSKNDPSDVLATGCTDPGTNQDDEGEADLDLEWSGAVARNASIIYVKCDNKDGGVLGSLVYTINSNLAPVISMSYGACEADLPAQFAPQYEPLIQQANAQGQTLMVSTGDSGAATCDGHASIATQGLSISGYASPSEVTAVGGTEFNGDYNNSSQYWDSTNGSTLSSAKSYISELAWDDSSAGTDLQDGTLAGSGGGASILFKKPTFQTGPGVPSDGARDIPDVSMPASVAHDAYIYCYNTSNGGYQGSCASGIDAAVGNNSVVGGTSVASPVFAGIVALLNQSLGNTPPVGLGNINPTLYTYAQSMPSAFHDVPAGNYAASNQPSGNVVPCQTGTPDCSTSGTMGYLTTPNYDLATGLGSVDGNVFVTNWPGGGGTTKTATNTTAEVNPSSVSVGATTGVTLSASVVPASGSGTPTGSVSFFDGKTQIGQAATLSSSGTASVTYDTSKLSAGSDHITAVYSGDANFATSTSPAVTLTVGSPTTGLSSTTTTLAVTANPSSSQSNVGSSVTFTAVVKPTSGTTAPTGTVTFNNGSTALGTGTLSGGTATFSTSKLAANQYSVTAVYAGDSNYNGSTSNASSLNVVDFQIAANPATITVSGPGQSGNAVLTISPMAGFNQSVSFDCSGLPTGATCSFASTSGGTTVTIATTGPVLSATSQRASVIRGGPLFAILLPGLLGIVFSKARKRVLSAMRVMMVIGAFALTSLLVACGGFGGGGGSGSGGIGGTQPGTSSVTITATAGQLSHQTTIQLIVQ
jgi:subtilase family serine protease